jgi:Zn-dependent protease/predicted transcriptional regulator
MKTVFNIGRIFGISISLHWTFLLLIFWIALVDFMGGIRPEEIVWTFIFLISILISLLAHEAGHALMAYYFGIRATGVILLPVGGVASIPSLPKKPGQEILITLAGPAVNLAIAAILLLFIRPYSAYWIEPENIGAVNGGNFIFQLQVINLSLGLFNLVPAFPLDGGRILRIILAFNMNIVKATRVASMLSLVIGSLLIILGIVIVHVLPVLVGLFIFFASRAEEYYLQLKTIAHGVRFKDVLMHDYASVDANATVMAVSAMLINNHSKFFIAMENGSAVGTIHRMQIIESIAEMKYDVKIKELMKCNLEFINGNEKIENYIEKLARKEERLYPVMDHNHFAGVVNFQHVIEYLLLHADSSKEYGRIKSLAHFS